jgi:HK97 family phage prohead protease
MSKTFVLSDGTKMNSHGFILDLESLSLERFRANPVMLYNHDRSNLIGRWNNIRLENNKLLADAEFDTDDAIAKEVSRKVEKGFLRGCSLGICVKKLVDSDSGLLAKDSELLEASLVAVPSDAGAVKLYDAHNEPTTLEIIKLEYNKGKGMEKTFELSAATLTTLGLRSGATAQEVEQAVLLKDTKIVELTKRLEALDKARVLALVDSAVAEKKIGADEKDTYVSLAEKDYAGVEKILSRMTGVSPIAKTLNQTPRADRYAGKSWDELDRLGLLASLRAEQPEEYQKMYDLKFKGL